MRRGKAALLAVGAAVVAVGIVLLAAQTLRPSAELKSVVVYCGNSMRPAVEEIAEEFKKREGVFVEPTYGGSETLFPQIKLSKEGDVFVCHDPFADKLQADGLLGRTEVVGFLEPAIIVPKGNPKGIHSLRDVATAKLRVGTTDPRYATCGEMVEAKLKEHGWAESYADHPNFVLQSRSHADIATALVAGQLDAGIVWNFVTHQFAGRTDRIPTGETFPETRVTFCLLSCSKQPDLAGRFLGLAGSDFGRGVFAKYGYARESAGGTP
jgi:molybdate transport system substrate-binding protein